MPWLNRRIGLACNDVNFPLWLGRATNAEHTRVSAPRSQPRRGIPPQPDSRLAAGLGFGGLLGVCAWSWIFCSELGCLGRCTCLSFWQGPQPESLNPKTFAKDVFRVQALQADVLERILDWCYEDLYGIDEVSRQDLQWFYQGSEGET